MSKKCPTDEIDRSIVSQLDSWIHQGFCSEICDSQQPISPIGFLFLKLPPPACAVLLVYYSIHILTIDGFCFLKPWST